MITPDTLDRILRFDGGGLPVVSIYLRVDVSPDARRALRSRAGSLLHQIRPLAENRSLAHDVRLSVREDVEHLEELVQHRWKPGAVALFSCSGAQFFEAVHLPRAVRDRAVADATPWVRPMLAVLDEYHRCCVALVDRKSARVWDLYLGEMRDARRVQNRALRKPNYAGWHGRTEHRVRNRAEDLARLHYRRVAVALDELFRADRYDLLAVAGHEHEIPRFLEFLPQALRARVGGTFSVSPNTATVADIRKAAEDIVDRYERDEERRLVAEVVESAAAGGLAALGLERCLWAGSVASVQTLLVQEGAVVPGVVCDASGWLARSGERCPLCGRPTRRTRDVLDALVEAVIETGGSIEHVQAETQLRELTAAATLRFPVPPEPRGPG